MTERHNHSMIVKYVEPSMDAAIAEGAKDFRFVNNTEAPIYIEGYTYGGKIYFTLYGEEYRPADRKVTYESETLETIDPTTELTADPEKAFEVWNRSRVPIPDTRQNCGKLSRRMGNRSAKKK